MSASVNITTLQSQNDSARPYKWDVVMNIPNTGDTLINMRCTTSGQPQPNYSPIDVLIRGFTKKEAGAIEWNELSFTVIEVQDYTILSTLWEWGQLQFNNKDGKQADKGQANGGGYSGGYGTDMVLNLLTLEDTTAATWLISGAICTSISPPDMGSDKSGTVDMSFSVAYDYAEFTQGKANI